MSDPTDAEVERIAKRIAIALDCPRQGDFDACRAGWKCGLSGSCNVYVTAKHRTAARAALPSRAEIERQARERALAVPEVWSQEERDGLSAAFTKASERHGHYESLFAAVAWFLRHRLALIPQEPQS